MVINLQKRYLVLFLSQAHKNRIAPVQILGQVVYQDEPLDPCATFCVDREHVWELKQTLHHVGAKYNLHDIVNLHNP